MASTTVTFQVHAELNKGEFVHLLGDIPQLGSFSLDQAVKMHVDRSEWPWWKITVQLPKGCSIKYKSVCCLAPALTTLFFLRF